MNRMTYRRELVQLVRDRENNKFDHLIFVDKLEELGVRYKNYCVALVNQRNDKKNKE
jgi:hypothetical protein